MSRTVSFRASEKLDEFLEQEAERRLTTKSTVVQMMVAERYRQLQDERQDEPAVSEVKESETDRGEFADSGKPGIFDRQSDHWYVPDSSKGNQYAVEAVDGRVHYYKTMNGAETRLRREYE